MYCVGTMPNFLNITEGGTCSYHRVLTVNHTAVSSETPEATTWFSRTYLICDTQSHQFLLHALVLRVEEVYFIICRI